MVAAFDEMNGTEGQTRPAYHELAGLSLAKAPMTVGGENRG